MAKNKFSGFFKSSDGKSKIQYYIYEPECNIRAIVQISHGMCEYLEMYEPLIDFLCDKGILVCGNDHLGHGNSVESSADYGYFGEKDGWKYLVKDLEKLHLFIEKEYPGVPYFLLGHSMGSFVARLYTACYGEKLDGAIFMGTSGPVFGTFAGIAFVRLMYLLKDGHYRSDLVNKIAFGAYNQRYTDEGDDWAWLCHDREFRKRYHTDERNSFIFTLCGFKDLLALVHRISVGKWYKTIPKNLPYLFVSGTEDPVGQYGKGVIRVTEKMRKYHCENVTAKLYPGDRHVLIREDDGEQVMRDLMTWLNRQIVLRFDR